MLNLGYLFLQGLFIVLLLNCLDIAVRAPSVRQHAYRDLCIGAAIIGFCIWKYSLNSPTTQLAIILLNIRFPPTLLATYFFYIRLAINDARAAIVGRLRRRLYLREKAFELGMNRYTSLAAARKEIRLLTLLPGEFHTPIRATLSSLSLNDAYDVKSAYEAISYTWGTARSPDDIFVDDKPFHATQNLVDALRDLRYIDRPRKLWVDAVCTNQFNNFERNQQVAIMRDIYEKASTVLVWLGKQSTDSMLAFDFLSRIEGSQDEVSFIANTIGDDGYIPHWRALHSLFSCSYWTRAWIVQEVSMASSIVVECRCQSASWDLFVMCDTIYQKQKTTQSCQPSLWFAAVERATDTELMHVVDLAAGPASLQRTRQRVADSLVMSAMPEVHPNSLRLTNLIQDHWASKATDPLDKIYALVGLASDCAGFNIDYDLDILELHKYYFRFLMQSTRRIDMLGYAGRLEDIKYQKEVPFMPVLSSGLQGYSFLPTFLSAIPAKCRLSEISRVAPYSADSNINANASLQTEQFGAPPLLYYSPTYLQVQGVELDRISHLGPTFTYNASDGREQTLHKISEYIRDAYAWAQRMGSLRACALRKPDPRFARNLDKFWRVLICNRTLEGSLPDSQWRHRFEALVGGSAAAPSDYSPMPDPDPDLARFVLPYQLTVLQSMASRSLFVTATGDFGVGPKGIYVPAAPEWFDDTDEEEHEMLGDKLVLFLGCNVPMVKKDWRHKLHKDRTRLSELDFLCGWAYVQNYMSGQALRHVELGRKELTEFRIL